MELDTVENLAMGTDIGALIGTARQPTFKKSN